MTHLKFTGYCMLLGGALMFLGNAIFSPMLPTGGPASEAAASTEFVWRLGTNALTVFLLMVGSIGIYKYQSEKFGAFGTFAFGLAFVGSAMIFAHEWGQVFYMHTMASANPEAFNILDGSSPTFFLIELALSLGGFSLGWILLAVASLMAKVLPKLGPILLLSGFLIVPIMSAALSSPIWGGVIGGAFLGGGLMMMGLPLVKKG